MKAGNLYVNRNIIGAVVGFTFGALRRRGLSGQPQGGGPLYLGRLTRVAPLVERAAQHKDRRLSIWPNGWTARTKRRRRKWREPPHSRRRCFETELAGPVGERNIYALHPRGKVLLAPVSTHGLYRQLAAALASGNTVVIDKDSGLEDALATAPASVKTRLSWSADWQAAGPFAGALVEGDADRVRAVNSRIATLEGPLVLVQAASMEEVQGVTQPYNLNWLLEEVSSASTRRLRRQCQPDVDWLNEKGWQEILCQPFDSSR